MSVHQFQYGDIGSGGTRAEPSRARLCQLLAIRPRQPGLPRMARAHRHAWHGLLSPGNAATNPKLGSDSSRDGSLRDASTHESRSMGLYEQILGDAPIVMGAEEPSRLEALWGGSAASEILTRSQGSKLTPKSVEGTQCPARPARYAHECCRRADIGESRRRSIRQCQTCRTWRRRLPAASRVPPA